MEWDIEHLSGKEILRNRTETEKELEEGILELERQLLGLKLKMVSLVKQLNKE